MYEIEEVPDAVDSRKGKRWWNKHTTETEKAYRLGEAHSILRYSYKNPYPPGIRHTEYDRGFGK